MDNPEATEQEQELAQTERQRDEQDMRGADRVDDQAEDEDDTADSSAA